MKQTFDIRGMTCSACQNAVTRAVNKLDGIDNVNVSLMTNSMSVDYDENSTTAEQIVQSVKNAGYDATLKQKKNSSKNIMQEKTTDIFAEELKSMSYRLKISIPLMILLMYISMGHMLGLPLPFFLDGYNGSVNFALTQLLISIPVIFVNRAYFIRGFKSLKNLTPNMDTLIALGSSAALLYGTYTLYKMSYAMSFSSMELVMNYRHNLYFESSVMILTLITVGKYFETKSKRKTSNAISMLKDLRPKIAHLILSDNESQDIDIEDVKVGEILAVKVGEAIPLDGIIVKGQTSIDQSSITGESLPVDKKEKDSVIGSTINKGSYIEIKVSKTGSDTLLSKIIDLVNEASIGNPPIQSLADKISGIFVPVVISISLLSFIYWMLQGMGIEFALNIAISVLVISCPCALGLATPVSVMVATGMGAKNGILFKDASSLETLKDTDVVIFDKTGTLTLGKPVVTDIVLPKNISENKLFNFVVPVEKKSQQPIANAIVNYGKKFDISNYSSSFTETSGLGVNSIVQEKNITIGNKKLMEEKKINFSDFEKYSDKFANQGKTPIYVAIDKNVVSVIAVADTLKSTSKDTIQALKNFGIKTYMLTGDNEKTAKYIAEILGLDEYVSNVLPHEKDEVLQKIKSDSKKTVMVGDGINDAVALTRADIGISLSSGTDIAIGSSDVILMKNDLQDVVNAIELSKKSVKNIKQNLFWAFFYNVICIPLAFGLFYKHFGLLLNPMFAAAAMSFSSIFVVSNALRLRNYKPILNKTYVNSDNHSEVNMIVFDKNIEISNKMEEKQMKKLVKIEGMMCGHCQATVEKVLKKLDENANVTVSLDDKNAVIESNNQISDETIKNAVTDAGYEVIEINEIA